MNPNLLSLSTTFITLGKLASTYQAVEFSFANNPIAILRSSSWGFYGAVTPNITIRPSSTTLTGSNTIVTSSFTVQGLIPDLPTDNGVHIGLDTLNNYAGIQLNAPIGSYIDFSESGVDFRGRIICNNSNKNLSYEADSHSFNNSVTITGNITASNLKNGSSMWFANADTTVPNNSWTSLNSLFLSRNGGSPDFVTWINQGTGFRNTSGKALRITASFSCQRTGGDLGVTAIRFFVNNTFSLGTQDVSPRDAVTIACSTFLLVNETIQCQIYQSSGSNQNYAGIVVSINYDTFY